MAAQAPLGPNSLLLQYQAYAQDKFHLYRNGLPGATLDISSIRRGMRDGNPVAIARWNQIIARTNTLPRPGNFQFTQGHRQRLGALAAARRIRFRGWRIPPIPRPSDDAQVAITNQLNNFRNLLRSTMRYIKCLGWGGEGVLTLWRYQPSTGQSYLVVLKQTANGNGTRSDTRPRLFTGAILRERTTHTVSANLEENVSLSFWTNRLISTRCCVEHHILCPGS